jgi:hypothetical protein
LAAGYPEKGIALGREALALAEHIAHPFSFTIALQYNSMLQLDLGEPELALQRLEAAEAIAAEQRLSLVLEPQFVRSAALRCYGLTRLADALIRLGEYDTALATAKEGLIPILSKADSLGIPKSPAT